MSTQRRSRAVGVATTDGSSGWTRSLARAAAGAVLAGAVALAFVVWPLAVGAAAVSAFAVYAVSSAVRGAREMYGVGGSGVRFGSTDREAGGRRPDSQSLARGGRLR